MFKMRTIYWVFRDKGIDGVKVTVCVPFPASEPGTGVLSANLKLNSTNETGSAKVADITKLLIGTSTAPGAGFVLGGASPVCAWLIGITKKAPGTLPTTKDVAKTKAIIM